MEVSKGIHLTIKYKITIDKKNTKYNRQKTIHFFLSQIKLSQLSQDYLKISQRLSQKI